MKLIFWSAVFSLACSMIGVGAGLIMKELLASGHYGLAILAFTLGIVSSVAILSVITVIYHPRG